MEQQQHHRDRRTAAAGAYTVTVTDAAGCTSTASVNITQPAAALTSTSSVTDESAPGALDGSIALSPTGGTAPYTFNWSNGQTTQTATGLAGGVYTCTITDGNGCTFVVTDTVTTIVAVSVGDPLGMDIFPNPNQGMFFVSYELPAVEDLTIQVYNAIGQIVWKQVVPATQVGKVHVVLGDKAAGVYSVELQAGLNKSVRKIVVEK
ncbi:MAG: T9SS type A sorting domain-containing protein [Bacteroidia bacterium]